MMMMMEVDAHTRQCPRTQYHVLGPVAEDLSLAPPAALSQSGLIIDTDPAFIF